MSASETPAPGAVSHAERGWAKGSRIGGILCDLRRTHPAAYAEVEFHFDLEGEPDEPNEWQHAFVDAFCQAEDLGDAPLVRAYRKALIQAGWYRQMSERDLRLCVVTSGTKWEFKLDKVPYRPGHGDLRVWLAALLTATQPGDVA